MRECLSCGRLYYPQDSFDDVCPACDAGEDWVETGLEEERDPDDDTPW